MRRRDAALDPPSRPCSSRPTHAPFGARCHRTMPATRSRRSTTTSTRPSPKRGGCWRTGSRRDGARSTPRASRRWTRRAALRFHIGLEDVADLKADLDAGFARLRAAA
ncbi:hypothetical protein FV225_28665 [Methylobacterium sp. WL93]|nr:hypothetical protein FV225_28665 [Methylobacterium sp. WL93]